LLAKGLEPSVDNGVELIIEIQKSGGAEGVFFQMDESDVETLMQLPYTMHASDGGVRVLGEGVPHPRNYGTFPRVISHYVRNRGIIPLEEAIRKMTSLPAQAFQLKDRGLLKEGMFADITIFNFETIKDTASFSQPHQYPEGIVYVVVNGNIVVEDNKHTGAYPGMVLYGSGKEGEVKK
jgi:N-acyl-D-amino-acid deacylase